MSFGKSDPPPAPDYAGAATAQGAANRETAIASSRLNNPNVVNPYGTQTWTENGPDGRPTLTQTLSRDQQALLNQQNQIRGLLGGLGTQGATALQGVVGRQLDLSHAPAAGSTDITAGAPGLRDSNFAAGAPGLRSTDFTYNAPAVPDSYEGIRNRVIDASMARANEDYARQSDQANSDLIAAGIRPGTEAYADRQQMIERSRNDARTQAEIAGGNAAAQAYGVDAGRRAAAVGENQNMFGASLNARQQAIDEARNMFGASQTARQQTVSENAARQGAMDRQRQTAIGEILAQRQTPLNEINALMSGSQVQNPFAIPGAAQNTNIAPPPIFGAATAQYGADMNAYNAQQQQGANMLGGLFSLGSAALGAPAGTFTGPNGLFSDRRLKKNIVRIGTHILGIGLYAWDYLWGEHAEGVMADEVLAVMPEAVLQHPSGYMMVDYGMLNHAN